MADKEEEVVEGPVQAPSAMGATFAERKAASEAASKKAVSTSENKSVSASRTKNK